MLSAPELISDLHLSMYLTQLSMEGKFYIHFSTAKLYLCCFYLLESLKLIRSNY